LEVDPGLIGGGFALPRNHLVFGENLALPHLGASCHGFLSVARRNVAVIQ
jgi:hypothetical protein